MPSPTETRMTTLKKPTYKLRKYIVVVDQSDGSYATAMDVTDKGPREIEKIEDGLFRKVDFDRFYVDKIRRKHSPQVRR